MTVVYNPKKKRISELMCVGALAEQFNSYYKFKIDWSNSSCKYFIMYDYNIKKYTVGTYNTYRPLGIVFMPKDIAEKVCEILNNKEVEL